MTTETTTTTATTDTITALGIWCADLAIEQGATAGCIPMSGDYDALESLVGGEPTRDQMRVFESAFAATLAAAE